MYKKRIVITGIGIHTPIGDTLESYYNNLIAGKSGITRMESVDTSLVRCKIGGDLGKKGRLKIKTTALEKSGAETLLAAREMAGDELGGDWRPLRLNFALRGANRVLVSLRLDGPAAVEIDDLQLSRPRIVPAPRRLVLGDAGDNFRPKGRRPLKLLPREAVDALLLAQREANRGRFVFVGLWPPSVRTQIDGVTEIPAE